MHHYSVIIDTTGNKDINDIYVIAFPDITNARNYADRWKRRHPNGSAYVEALPIYQSWQDAERLEPELNQK
jgi:hypothetical protein